MVSRRRGRSASKEEVVDQEGSGSEEELQLQQQRSTKHKQHRKAAPPTAPPPPGRRSKAANGHGAPPGDDPSSSEEGDDQQQQEPITPFSEEHLQQHIAALQSVASHPETFFRADAATADALTDALSFFFEYGKRTEGERGVFRKPLGPLPRLVAPAGADLDTLWSQVQLRNAPLARALRKAVERLSDSGDLWLAADLPLGDGDEDGDDSSEGGGSGGEGGSDDGEEEEEEGGAGRRAAAYSDDDDDEEEARLEAALDAAGAGAGGGSDDSDEDLDEDLDDELDDDDYGRSRSRSRGKGAAASKPVKDGRKRSRLEREGFFDYDDMEHFADETVEDADDDLDDAVLEELYGAGAAATAAAGETATFADLFGDDDYAERGSSADEEGSGDGSQSGGSDEEEEEEEGEGSDGGGGDGGDGEDGEGEEEEEDWDAMTPHQRAQARMKGKISELEEELLRERPWALRGEVTAKDRPENSLLEAALDVERATRPAPPITVEKTANLEDVIKQRILEEKWDDVAPKNIELTRKPREEAPEVSTERPDGGLAAVYEKEYLKQALGVTDDDPDKSLKEELKRDYARLSAKLDALCNFHYRPRAHVPEAEVQADVPAIAMEEALPTAMSAAAARAPEEVYARKRGRGAVFLEGSSEMDADERGAARRAKKRARNASRRAAAAEARLVAAANPGLGNPYERRKLEADLRGARNVTEGVPADGGSGGGGGKEFSTSAKFFGALQAQVAKGVRDASAAARGGGGGGGGEEKKRNRGAELRL